MLVFAFRSEIWIVQNFNFTVFEDFCLSLSWKYRFLQNVNHAKVPSKTNKYCKFHVDLTRRRLSKSRFKKLGMVPKKLYRNTLKNATLADYSVDAFPTSYAPLTEDKKQSRLFLYMVVLQFPSCAALAYFISKASQISIARSQNQMFPIFPAFLEISVSKSCLSLATLDLKPKNTYCRKLS